jgi:hypothetical protein
MVITLSKEKISICMAASLPNGNLICSCNKKMPDQTLVGTAVNDLGGRKAGKLEPDDTQGGNLHC